ncbi:F-box only protein 48 isoform 1-T8 [Molossus nigricans]|uniref:F-box only protein n=1 Tax=Molossus molossus TaxID=27622 RepID=A0A7J8E1Q8_MOLMO|nr:F-box only protein 48 isoform X1 [Molossus molossus]XP_036118633.1 F-box only protein 48 isoform X1 [Molossus molossus]XP_036118634.1 F-box only protein 48 isoform X1 [Molossus molossus]XP_036118635.1 F-box only protein 48 isoform X1 [Molossus molossus]XP_036118636.1 F-box only protein 48 isoform X1 [Molossus molossus]KAF6429353.1 F-box protein 48 [Molossus molossus]
MQNNSERNHNSRVSDIELNSVDAENSQNNFFERLPEEVIRQIFSSLDMQSLCRASMTCRRWYDITKDNDSLWKPHCLALRAVCKREIDDDQKSGYSFKDTLLRNYQKSQVKLHWLSGRYSNICSPDNLPEAIMCPMDAETWGEILEVEMERPNHKQIS